MSDDQRLAHRKKDYPTIDEVTTLLWTGEMGKRLALVRMKALKQQKELAGELGVTQAAISRLELGQSQVCERITVASLKKAFGTAFPFIAFGVNPERYNAGSIVRQYWDTRLRVRRVNRSPYSKPRR